MWEFILGCVVIIFGLIIKCHDWIKEILSHSYIISFILLMIYWRILRIEESLKEKQEKI